MSTLELFPATTFADRLRAELAAGVKRHTQREVANMIGCDRANVSMLLRGNMTLASAEVLLIAIEALDAAKSTAQLAAFEVKI